MALQIGDTAPDFEAETTEGRIRFHDWLGDSWAVLFSHPRDFTPVCTTELGYMAKIKPDFDSRNVKIAGLSVDPVDNHAKWAADIEETQGTAPNYPMIADTDFNVSKLYGLLPAYVSVDPTARAAPDRSGARERHVAVLRAGALDDDLRHARVRTEPQAHADDLGAVLRLDHLIAGDARPLRHRRVDEARADRDRADAVA